MRSSQPAGRGKGGWRGCILSARKRNCQRSEVVAAHLTLSQQLRRRRHFCSLLGWSGVRALRRAVRLTLESGLWLNCSHCYFCGKSYEALIVGKILSTAGGRWRRLKALLLLLLVFHAVQAGAAHTHLAPNFSVGQAGAPPCAANISEGLDSRGINNHAQCLLCRLQRNLSSSLHNSAAASIAPHSFRLLIEPVTTEPGHRRPSRASAGRAPPLH